MFVICKILVQASIKLKMYLKRHTNWVSQCTKHWMTHMNFMLNYFYNWLLKNENITITQIEEMGEIEV